MKRKPWKYSEIKWKFEHVIFQTPSASEDFIMCTICWDTCRLKLECFFCMVLFILLWTWLIWHHLLTYVRLFLQLVKKSDMNIFWSEIADTHVPQSCLTKQISPDKGLPMQMPILNDFIKSKLYFWLASWNLYPDIQSGLWMTHRYKRGKTRRECCNHEAIVVARSKSEGFSSWSNQFLHFYERNSAQQVERSTREKARKKPLHPPAPNLSAELR